MSVRDRDDYDDVEEWSPEAAAADSVREMPPTTELLYAELGEPVDYEAAELIGDYFAAILSGHVDERVFEQAVQAKAATASERDAYLARLRSVRRELAGIVLALRDGDSLALRAQGTAAQAYAALSGSKDGVGSKRARLVAVLESLASATDDSGALDGDRWAYALAELREIEPSLRDVDDEKLWSAYASAADGGNALTRTAARLSLGLDLFGDRMRHVGARSDLSIRQRAIVTCEKSFERALKRHPIR